MKPTAQLERFRMALEVIASGPSFEPGTKIAKIALTDPWVSQEVIAISDDIEDAEHKKGMSLNEAVERAREAVERARETEPCQHLAVDGPTGRCVYCDWQVAEPEPDDEPEPISLAEIDEELDAELDGAAEEVAEPKPKRVNQRRGQDGLLPGEREILAWIREKGEVTPEQVRTKFGIEKEAQKRYAKTRFGYEQQTFWF